MKLGKLDFSRAADRPDLLSPSTRAYLSSTAAVAWVTAIDPTYHDGNAFCNHYGIDPSIGGNCIVLQASRADKKWYAACLVPTGKRIDVNGLVRKQLGARRVSLASKDDALNLTGMEYGSINVVGLPGEWPIFIDAKLAAETFVVMGSGLVASKMIVPGDLLATLPNSKLVEGLGK